MESLRIWTAPRRVTGRRKWNGRAIRSPDRHGQPESYPADLNARPVRENITSGRIITRFMLDNSSIILVGFFTRHALSRNE